MRGSGKPKPLRPQHLSHLVTLGAPSLAPDGRRGVVIRSEVVPSSDDAPPRYRRRLWLVDLASGGADCLTAGEQAAAPSWSPCGRFVAFLAPPRDGADAATTAAQLHVINVSGGEARCRTSFTAGVDAFVWGRDGTELFVTTREDWRDESSRRGVGRWVDDRCHRFDGVGWIPTGALSLWRVAADEPGAGKRLFSFDQAPSEIALSGNGEQLLYLAPGDASEADRALLRLWSRRLTRSARPRELLSRPGRLTNLSPSPDGGPIAFQAPSDLVTIGAPLTTFVVPARGGQARALTDDLESAPSTVGDTRAAGAVRPRWRDAATLVVAINRAGRSHLHTLSLDGQLTPLQDGDQTVVSFDAVGESALAVIETATRPAVLVARGGDGQERTLLEPNAAFLATRAVADHQRHTCTSSDGETLTYWVMQPATPRRDRALVVQVHGGPYANYGEAFMFEFQVLAAAGYTVVYGNPRGGSSFGAAFAGAIKGAYGSVDADDVMTITDAALANHSDPNAPVHLTGGSYGGFMTNWLTAHSQRYRSAVTQRSICNWLSFFGTSDIGPWFGGEEAGGNPWDHSEQLWDRSPLKYVANVRTPTLVIHSEHDHRCPIEQAEQWFTALKVLGHVDTRLLRFPDEGHDLSRSGRPDRRIERLEAILAWFETHA